MKRMNATSIVISKALVLWRSSAFARDPEIKCGERPSGFAAAAFEWHGGPATRS
jgi:hypothetical protein